MLRRTLQALEAQGCCGRRWQELITSVTHSRSPLALWVCSIRADESIMSLKLLSKRRKSTFCFSLCASHLARMVCHFVPCLATACFACSPHRSLSLHFTHVHTMCSLHRTATLSLALMQCVCIQWAIMTYIRSTATHKNSPPPPPLLYSPRALAGRQGDQGITCKQHISSACVQVFDLRLSSLACVYECGDTHSHA